jgi:hypothetical protein
MLFSLYIFNDFIFLVKIGNEYKNVFSEAKHVYYFSFTTYEILFIYMAKILIPIILF